MAANITIPIDSLVVLVGPTASGKSHFAEEHFPDSAVLSVDRCRELISDDPNNRGVSREALHVMLTIANHRLRQGRLTVIDATCLNPEVRQQFCQLAEKHDRSSISLLFDTPLEQCRTWNRERGVSASDELLQHQVEVFQQQRGDLVDEPFDQVHVLSTKDRNEVSVRLQNTGVAVEESGPFDVIGDLHGCLDELKRLLERLGYVRDERGYRHPEGRKAVFLGDLTDRGPDSVGCLALVMDMVEHDRAFYIPGNHCEMLYDYINGDRDQLVHGLQTTVDELSDLEESTRKELEQRFVRMFESAPPYLVLDEGELVVTHAGIQEEDIGDVSDEIVQFCRYGDTTGNTRPDGFPVRRDWALAYRGDPFVVYGHTPAKKAMNVNGTINIDQGAVYGGYLTSYRYPEDECVNVKSEKAYHPDEPRDILATQFKRAEKRHRMDLLNRSFHLPVGSDDEIHISQQITRRGLDRIARSDLSLNQLVYLPSEPARGMPAAEQGSSFDECCEEMVNHFDEHGLNQIRVLRETPPMSPCVLVCMRDEQYAQARFHTDETVLIWDETGQRISLDERQKHRLNEQVFDMPWLVGQESCVVIEGLFHDSSSSEEQSEQKWIHRDRYELEEVVNRLQDARSRVGAVEAVLKDLDDIHSSLGQLAERAFGMDDAIASQQQDEGWEQASGHASSGNTYDDQDEPFFVPMRVVGTDERLLIGTVEEVPSTRAWSLAQNSVPDREFVHTLELDEAAGALRQLWNEHPSAAAWWVLPRFDDEVFWNPDMVPCFHLVGQQMWNMSELISPRRWWGNEASANWAGWNSSKEIFALGRESARRFVGAQNPSFVVQTVAAQAGLAHW